MLFPNRSTRRSVPQPRQPKKLEVESLEVRRLLSSDGILPDPQRLIAPGGIVSGIKWEDVNRNGQRDANEPGLAGVNIYADMNNNGRLDANEPSVLTQRENPDTRFDEGGRYQLFVPPGEHVIREVVPEGYRQTYPLAENVDIQPVEDPFATVEPRALDVRTEPGEVFSTEVAITVHPLCIRPYELDVIAVAPGGGPDGEGHSVEVISHGGPQLNGCGGDTTVFPIDIIAFDEAIPEFELAFVDIQSGDIIGRIPVNFGGEGIPGGHLVEVNIGDRLEGLDFGNTRVRPAVGSIEGRKWLDRDGDGKQGPQEPGLGGVTVYIDSNNNGVWDRREPQAVTQFEDPFTDFDEGGLYRFDRVPAGTHVVRELVPEGYTQTFPRLGADVISSETGRFTPQHAWDFDVTNVSLDSDGEATTTRIELSVSWNNGCGQLFGDAAHAVIGDTILVDARGVQVGDICTTATKTETFEVEVSGLSQGIYSVVGTLHEEEGAALGVVAEIELGTGGAHRVEVSPGEVTSEINFGNRRTGKGESIAGTKWNDKNGDGVRQRDEPGLGGVTIYVDANYNGQLDEGETFTVSSTDPDQLGRYQFNDVEPGIYHIREVVPEGYRQTSPGSWWPVDPTDPLGPDGLNDPLPGIVPTDGGYHYAAVYPGSQLEGLDFGNQSTRPGAIAGIKWHDANGNGVREEGEEGLAGVTIYLDTNYNRQLDEGEPSAVSGDDGSYAIRGIRPGTYTVLEVVPEGYQQTFPGVGDWWVDPPRPWPADVTTGIPQDAEELRIFLPQQHVVNVQPGQVIEGIHFGNQKVEPGSISGTKWHDANGNGIREKDETGIAGVTIYVDLNFNGTHEENEPFAISQADDPATQRVDETGWYTIADLKPLTSYQVREIVPDGYEQTYPGWNLDLPFRPDGVNDPLIGDIAIPFPFPQDFHNVWVGAGQAVEGIDFGNQKVAEPGFISGRKWEDTNGNGQWDEGEQGLPGFVLFADTNRNGVRDFSEPFAVSQRDNPDTRVDEAGQYTLKVRPGSYLILEQQQRGFEQTYPNPLREVTYPFNLGHTVEVASGQEVTEIDFGNMPVPIPSVISGTTWFDFNANGVIDRGDEPISGVTVYLDANDNGQFDEGERSTVSGSLAGNAQGDALIAIDGYYSFDVPPGDYVVRQTLPDAHIQTFPVGSYALGESVVQTSRESFAEGLELTGVATSTTSPNDAGQSHTMLTLRSTWSVPMVEVHVLEVAVEGNQIAVQLAGHVLDPSQAGADEEGLVTEIPTTVDLGPLDFGEYEVRVELFQEPPFGPEGNDEPFPGPVLELESKFQYAADDAHRVSVTSRDAWYGGRDFGHIAVPTTGNNDADSRMGEDPHSGQHDDTATPVEFHNGHLRVNSYVDTDGDQDVFRFVGTGKTVTGEGGRADGSDDLKFELLDANGSLLASAGMGEPMEAATHGGETYFLRISGGTGQYQLDLFESAPGEEASEPLAGDTNGDRKIDFADFLTLSANFGKEVDGAFADGDFTGDAEVSFEDFLILSSRFGTSG